MIVTVAVALECSSSAREVEVGDVVSDERESK